ncbi:hypothetical protein [Micromonospora sp. NPDC047074]|uniref:hypothetical protein n=1 Tax=Micromonospora sp. NPDC047074 TaxID=3154339 RepID=UPI0033ED0F9E
MDAEATGLPETGRAAGEHGIRVGTDGRPRTVVLAVAVLGVLLGGGWWWQAEAPSTGPVARSGPTYVTQFAPSPRPEAGARPGALPEARVVMSTKPDGTTSVWVVDPATGSVIGTAPGNGNTYWALPGGGTIRTDPSGGDASRVDVGPADARRLVDERLDANARRGQLASFPNTIWTSRGALGSTEKLVEQASAGWGARHLFQYRCVGSGELLIVFDGVRTPVPIKSACDGSVRSAEITARGGPFQVTMASANADLIRVSAQLVALP